jgi:hypothetical protein
MITSFICATACHVALDECEVSAPQNCQVVATFIRDLPDHPTVFLGHIRNIVDRAFDLIWKAEIPNKRVPSEWMAIWKRNGERRIEEWETTFPQGVHRVRLLNLMTGTDKSVPCARHVTKGTYVLINSAHAFGDFGQHQEGAPVDAGAAYAALHSLH